MGEILAIVAGSNSAIITFSIYIALVMLLAWLSNRQLKSKSFMSEYFLGSRSLGVWAFALTFAATSASGGSFIGFPSMVYTHGWVVGLWIAGYMVVPLVAIGILGKRINQVARKTGAITIPDVLRDRFESVRFGGLATFLIVFFMIFNLIAQFKGGSLILQSLLKDIPLFAQSSVWVADVARDIPLFGTADPGYLICLLVFSIVVVAYTAYGGFRAVVWTDVMQGLVMVGGVALILPLAMWQSGGLKKVTQEMAAMTPPSSVVLEVSLKNGERARERISIPKNSWLVVDAEGESEDRLFRTKAWSEILEGASKALSQSTDGLISAIELTFLPHIERVRDKAMVLPLQIEVTSRVPLPVGVSEAGTYVSGPGPHATSSSGFLPLSLAVSFFFMWTFSSAGQPSNMVRLMAFDGSRTLRRSIFAVTVYYFIIYFSLVLIFCCARVLMPGWETESDRIMPEIASVLTFAIDKPWLAGLLVAAPFAAVMSTMDSFLLMISSALVRDIYQRNISPGAPEATIKRLSYGVTCAVGLGAMLAAVSPPQFLQDIIIFTGTGLSTSFLVPVVLALYWPRFNTQGAFAGMLGGFGVHIALYLVGYMLYGRMQPYTPMGFHSFLVGVLASAALAIVVSLRTMPPPERLVRKFFVSTSAKIQSSMFLFDAHLDLSMNATIWNRDLSKPLSEIRERELGLNDLKGRAQGTVSLPEMRTADIRLCVATQIGHSVSKKSTVPGWNSPEIAWAHTQGQLAWYRTMEDRGLMRQIANRDALDAHLSGSPDGNLDDPLGYILSLEGGDSLLTMDHLQQAYEYGLRALGPAHYGAGRYAPGTGAEGGLEPAGRELLKAMQQLGIILDVTHLTDEGFWEALDLYSGPVWASHSNCRALVPGQRQLSDEQIAALVERGAVIGAAFDAWMLVPNWIRGETTPESSGVKLEAIADHIDHVCQTAGSARHCGIGSDLDGGYGYEQTPQDVKSIADLQALEGILKKRGYSEDDIAGIMHRNWIDFLRKAWA